MITKPNGVVKHDGAHFTAIDYDRAYQVQQGCCGICGKHQSTLSRKLFVDHDHNTGVFRGLLCRKCNVGMGNLGDSVDTVIRAVHYLQKTILV